MGFQSFKLRFRGREAWRSINKVLYIGLYTLVIFGTLFVPIKIMMWVYIGLGIVLPTYTTLFVNHLREMEKRDKGNKLVMGWLTHAYGSAEPVYFTPVKFDRVDKLSEENLKAIRDYVDECDELSKQTKVKTGFDVFKPKGLLYKKIVEKEEVNKNEMRKIIKEEMEEFMKYKDEFKKMFKNKDENNDEEESENDDGNELEEINDPIENNNNNK